MNNPYYVDESRPWFTAEAGWPEEVPKNWDFERVTLGEMFERTVKEFPDLNAIWFLDTWMKYRELNEKVNAFATAIHQLGLRKGDVMALMLPNSFQYVISYYACAKLGVIVTGVNPTYKPGEVKHQLKLTGAKGIVVLDVLYGETIAPIVKDTAIQHVIVTNVTDLAALSPLKRWLGKKLKKIPFAEAPAGSLQFKQLLKTPPALPKIELSADDVATYIMTGGTTGVPKAAILSHLNCVSNAKQAQLWMYKIKPGTAAIGVLPLFHSFAMTCVMNISLSYGGTMILFPRPPAVKELVETILRVSPPLGSIYVGAEVLFQRMAEWPEIVNYNLSGKITLCVSGAGPLHRPVQEKFEQVTGARLVEGYGLSESSPVVSAGPFWGNRKIGTIGLPFPGTEWKIVDAGDPNKELPQGDAGEIAVAGPQVMVGYLHHETETAETIVTLADGKRWLLTGDIGRMDPQGRITIEDRKKQLIKVRGYSVFPTEIETMLLGHESILEAAVAGLPDKEAGEIIKAWVVIRAEYKGKIKPEDLLKWAKDNFTHYKVPRYIDFIDELPKSLVGKVQRRQLQEGDPIFKEYHKK
ncbi:MAG: long-chain fatty acid--CoA ligase [Myxococcales bacterium]|nr:long-chain fatty acid--CoA ligase [Myxococcales bacterium]